MCFYMHLNLELPVNWKFHVNLKSLWWQGEQCKALVPNLRWILLADSRYLLGWKLKIGHEEFVAKGSFTFRPDDDPFPDWKMWNSHMCILKLESMEVRNSSSLLMKRWFDCSVEIIVGRSNVLEVDKSTDFRMCCSAWERFLSAKLLIDVAMATVVELLECTCHFYICL